MFFWSNLTFLWNGDNFHSKLSIILYPQEVKILEKLPKSQTSKELHPINHIFFIKLNFFAFRIYRVIWGGSPWKFEKIAFEKISYYKKCVFWENSDWSWKWWNFNHFGHISTPKWPNLKMWMFICCYPRLPNLVTLVYQILGILGVFYGFYSHF